MKQQNQKCCVFISNILKWLLCSWKQTWWNSKIKEISEACRDAAEKSTKSWTHKLWRGHHGLVSGRKTPPLVLLHYFRKGPCWAELDTAQGVLVPLANTVLVISASFATMPFVHYLCSWSPFFFALRVCAAGLSLTLSETLRILIIVWNFHTGAQ